MNNNKHLQELRKENKLKLHYIDIDLSNIKGKHRYSNVKYKLYKKTGYFLESDLAFICKQHYQKYSLFNWKIFVAYWFQKKITNIILAYSTIDDHKELNSNIVICGLIMYIKKPSTQEIYIRLLCSNTYCGGNLLRYMMRSYNDNEKYKRLCLNSETDALDFYKKNGFHLTNGFYMDMYGFKYPLLIYPTKSDIRSILKPREIIQTTFWPGIPYYIYTYFWYIIGILVLSGTFIWAKYVT